MKIQSFGDFTVITPKRFPVNNALLTKHLEAGAVIYFYAKDAPVFYDVASTREILNVLREMQLLGAAPNQARLVLQNTGTTARTDWAQEAIAAWQNNGGIVIFGDDFDKILEQEAKLLERYPLYDFYEAIK